MIRSRRDKEQIVRDVQEHMKTCCVCDVRKSFDDFYNMNNKSDGKSYRCKTCDGNARAKWTEDNAIQSAYSLRNRQLKYKYGVDIPWYEQQLSKQKGGCAICGCTSNNTSGERKDWNFAVDHCHTTGKVRGLLCNNCNRALGLFQDRLDIINNALEYLNKHKH